MKERSEEDGGMGPYSAKAYADLDIGEYRARFPEATKQFTDEQLFHIVSNTDDDMDDVEWIETFKKHSSASVE